LTPRLQSLGTATVITGVEAIHLAIPSVYGGPPPDGPAQWPLIHLVLVRIETADGLVGWGEAFGHNGAAAAKAALETLVAPLAIGLDSANIDGIGSHLRRALFPYGVGGPVGFALSGIDIALWDLAGKRAAKPLHRLLDPRSSATDVPAYASLLRYGDADLAGAAALDAVTRGHHAIKLHEATVDAVAATRAAIGPDVPLTLDVNCRWSADEAVELTRLMRPYRLDWIEEPCWPAEPSLLARIGETSGVPMAAGENAGSLVELERIATVGRAAYLQPSAAKIGGLSGLLAAKEIAARHGTGMATHSAYFGPGLAATLHFCAAFDLDCEWYDCRLEASPCGLVPVNGKLPLPDAPGLGIGIDDALLERYRIS
jgi:L-alanine-DL-glutamate epimerase-like enolase superfamily enzyme